MITLYHDIEQNYDSNADPKLCRTMVSEFLRLEKKHNVPTTYNVVGKLFEEQPDLVESIKAEGQEIAFHSYNHQKNWNPAFFSKEIDLCRKVSPVPLGYRSPRSQINQEAVRTIWENGFLWNAEGDHHNEPYFIYKGLVRLPISGDDWSLHQGKINSDKWVQNFSNLLKRRTYLAFGLHDYIASYSPEKILSAWERILQIAVESNHLLLNFSEAADLFRRTAISRYVKTNNRKISINNSYLSQSLERIIKTEVEKLNNPLIVNLYYLNNKNFLLTKDVYNIAIDSSILMNNGSENIDSRMQNSEIKAICADLIICINCTEYQFGPDHFVERIKQITKSGATCIITFPAQNEFYDSDARKIPEVIKHYFTRDEVTQWTDKIGPGHIVKIGEIGPFRNRDKLTDEIEFHSAEEKAGNWIFIGKVERQVKPTQVRRIIPISDTNFYFPNPFYESFRIYSRNIVKQFFKPVKIAGKYLISWIPFRLSH